MVEAIQQIMNTERRVLHSTKAPSTQPPYHFQANPGPPYSSFNNSSQKTQLSPYQAPHAWL